MPRRYAYECKGCGSDVLNIWDYCPHCGTEVDQSMFYGRVHGAPKPKDYDSSKQTSKPHPKDEDGEEGITN